MFGKLLKYEFKATGKWYGILFTVLAIASILLGLMVSNITSGGASLQNSDTFGIIYGFFSIIFFSACTALAISNLVITVRRFYQNIYGREGYLTWTLPANAHQIILSKMTMATIWYIASILGIIFSFIIMIAIVAIGSGVDFFQQFGVLLSYIPTVTWIQFLFYFILSSISGVLFLYLAISIGQLFQNHRVLMAFVSVFVLWIIFGTLGNAIYNANPFSYLINSIYSISYHGTPAIAFSYLAAYIYEIIKIVLFYLGIYYITQTKLNLE